MKLKSMYLYSYYKYNKKEAAPKEVTSFRRKRASFSRLVHLKTICYSNSFQKQFFKISTITSYCSPLGRSVGRLVGWSLFVRFIYLLYPLGSSCRSRTRKRWKSEERPTDIHQGNRIINLLMLAIIFFWRQKPTRTSF